MSATRGIITAVFALQHTNPKKLRLGAKPTFAAVKECRDWHGCDECPDCFSREGEHICLTVTGLCRRCGYVQVDE